MSDNLPTYDHLIVGAGIAGITAALELQRSGRGKWLMIDKGRSVGGRLATRRIDQYKFDHGAQFFTVRSSEFREVINRLSDLGLVREWCYGFQDGEGHISQDGHPRYVAKNGMNQLAKHFAAELSSSSIILQEKISKMELLEEHWQLTSESNQRWLARDVILTMPLTQVLELLTSIDIDIGSRQGIDEFRSELKTVDYDPCIAIMCVFNVEDLPSLDVPIQNSSGPISFVSENGAKGVSENRGALTIHLAPQLSRELWSMADQDILGEVMPRLQRLLDRPSLHRPDTFQIHRWRYAAPKTVINKPFIEWVPFFASSRALHPRILVAGEAFHGPKIEGAFLSGLAVGRYLLK